MAKRVPVVGLLLLAFVGTAMAQPAADVRINEAQRIANEAEQQAGKTERRVDELEQRVNIAQHDARDAAAAGGAGFLFGAFCALWAQNTGRNAWLWFFLGLIFSVFTVLVLLYKNSTDLSKTAGVGRN